MTYSTAEPSKNTEEPKNYVHLEIMDIDVKKIKETLADKRWREEKLGITDSWYEDDL